MAWFGFPISAGIFLITPLFVSIFYGEDWSEVIPVMQLLTISGGISLIGWNVGDVVKAIGRPRLQLNMMIITVVFSTPIMLLSVQHYGLIGISIAYICRSIFQIILSAIVGHYSLDVPIVEFIRAIIIPLIAGIIVFFSINLALDLSEHLPEFYRLIIAILCGGVAYVLALMILGRDILRLASNWLHMRLPIRIAPRKAVSQVSEPPVVDPRGW